MSTLLLRLAAPLQAWGAEAKFDARQTWREPSKSAVLGLIAGAMGIRREDAERLRKLEERTAFGVRVEQEGTLLRDFHTVKSYKSRGAALKNKVDKAYLTERYYLCDAVFLAAIEAGEPLLHEIDEALRHPAFPLYLGRRSCPPLPPVSLGIRPTPLRQTLQEEPWRASERYRQMWRRLNPNQTVRLRWMADAQPEDRNTGVRRDVPLSYDPAWREYAFRKAEEGYIELNAGLEDTVHDAMAEVEACT